MATPTKQDQYVLGIDIGGTKMDAQLYKVEGNKLSEAPMWTSKVDTPKGVEEHSAQIAELVVLASAEATAQKGILAGVGVGSPGRFNNGVIADGTATNLGKDPTDFDGVNLKDAYVKALAAKNAELGSIPLSVGNDGDAMLAGMLEGIQTGKIKNLTDQNGKEISGFSLPRKHVAVFGIGTGIGHAIAKVNDDGAFGFVTDGHASKLRVKVDDADWPLLETAKQRLESAGGTGTIVTFPDHTVRAEDLFRGPVLNALASATGEQADPKNPAHDAAHQFAGKYMARTIAVIKSAQSEDVEPANGWSQEFKDEAAKTSMYLVGGGVGGSPSGTKIIEHAADELKNLAIDDVQLVQFSGKNVAARAAAATVPKAAYRAAREVG